MRPPLPANNTFVEIIVEKQKGRLSGLSVLTPLNRRRILITALVTASKTSALRSLDHTGADITGIESGFEACLRGVANEAIRQKPSVQLALR